MKKVDSVKEIKSAALSRIIKQILYECLFGFIIVATIFGLIGGKLESGYVIIALIFLVFVIFLFRSILENIIEDYNEYKNPQNNSRFLRYGSPDKINKIISEVNNNPIYYDEKIAFNNKFIYIKSDLNSLCALEDIIALYKFTFKRNGQKSKIGIKYHDKFGKEYAIVYSYLFSDVDLDKIIKYLIPRCKNAKFGFTNDTLNYVKNYKVEEPNKYDNRIIKEIKVEQELVNEDVEDEYYDEDLEDYYDEDLEDIYSETEEEQSEEDETDDSSEIEEDEDDVEIGEDDDFFKEEFEFSYAKVKEVLKNMGYNNYATFKKEVYESKKVKRKKFDDKEKEVDYLVKALGYDDFEDFYYSNIDE